MVDPRFVLRCYLANGDYTDYFVDDCSTDYRENDELRECMEVECMTVGEWFEEDCSVTDNPLEDEMECSDIIDELGEYDEEG